MIPKYILLKDKINEDILKNIYTIGSNLPTEVELASMYDVSRSTVRQALSLLSDQGIISKHWGSGNTIINKPDNNKSKTVMVLLINEKSTEEKSLLTDISSVLMKNGMNVEFHGTNNSYQLERDYLKLLLNDIYGGLIINMVNSNLPSTNTDILQILLKRQTPIIFINNAPEQLHNPTVVTLDHYNKGYLMARHLINSGHRDLGGIFINNDIASVRTFSGFIDAIRDTDLDIHDDCILWCNRHDTLVLNRFLKSAYEKVNAIYTDDNDISGRELQPLIRCNLSLSKPLGKECAKALLELKKNGNFKSITIPFKHA